MISFTPVSPTFINTLEKGLQKKKYTQSPHAIWLQGTSWEYIGGNTVWTSPDNNHAVIIYHDPVHPIYGNTTDSAEIQGAITAQSANDGSIMAEMTRSKPEISETVSIQVPPGKIFEFPREQWIKQVWLDANPALFVPERWTRQWKVTLTEQKHCQFISQSPIDHVTFLRKDTPDGLVVAGGEPSFFNTTSFDLTLEPGIYYYEAFSYNLKGAFDVFLTETCTNDPERPWMFDDDGMDAFGHVKPQPPQKIDLTDPAICTISADIVNCTYETNVITNSHINRYVNNQLEGIYYFSGVEIEFPIPRRIRQIKIAGFPQLRDRIMEGTVVLQGKNEVSEPWSQITVLDDYLTPPDYANWILNHSVAYEETMELLFYRIFLGEQGRRLDIITEIELYD